MDGVQDILLKFDALEVIIIRASAFVGVCLFCVLVIWKHIKSFGGRGRGRRNTIRAKKQPVKETKKLDKDISP